MDRNLIAKSRQHSVTRVHEREPGDLCYYLRINRVNVYLLAFYFRFTEYHCPMILN